MQEIPFWAHHITQPGVEKVIDTDAYCIERLTLVPGMSIEQKVDDTVHMLIAIQGSMNITAPDGELLGTLQRGETGIVPVGVQDYALTASGDQAVVLKVWLPV